MTFPQTPLDVRVEAQVGTVWTDITADSYTRSPIGIEHGRSEEAVRTNPSKLGLELNNREGKYSPRNPRSPYYGLIGRNTPIRVSVPGAEPYLSVPEGVAGRATTPDHASLDITGDIDVRVDVAPRLWSGAGIGYELAGKYAGAGSRSWRFMVTGEGELMFTWSPNGTNVLEHRSPVLTPIAERMAVRATLDVNNGSGGYTLTYYVADTLAGPWTQVGQTVTTAGTTAIFASAAAVELGDVAVMAFTNHERRIYGAEIRSGIDGTVVAAPSFSAQAPGATSFTDSTGKVWTVANGASVSDRAYRFVGDVSAWPARWDTSGRDVWVPIEAAGILRRLGQGKKALASTLRRRLPSRAELLAYWPCEESAGATQAYSPLTNGSPLAVSGWDFAQDNTLSGSAPLPVIAPGGTMRGTIPASASTTWALCMPYRVDGTPPAAEQEMLSWQSTGTVRRWRITMSTTVARVLGYDVLGATIVDGGFAVGADLFVGWHRLEFTATQSGGTVNWEASWTQVGGGSASGTGSFAGTVGQATQIDTRFGTGLPDIRIGHLTAWTANVIAAAYDSADHGFTGEAADARMRRLATEEAATVSLVTYDGDLSLDAERLGPQRPDTLLNLLQEAADCDGGILYEDRAASRLIYRDRATLYNQTPRLVLDYTAEGEVGPPLEPVEDDQRTRNDVTVTRAGGSSSRAVLEEGALSVQAPPLGVGLYDEEVTLNLYEDGQTGPIAWWRLHMGTWDESRYPTVRLMLHAAPHLISAYLKLRVGDRIQITNPPSWLPPGPLDLIVQGVSEVIDQYTWDAVLPCTPAGPWTVGVVDDAALGRADTDGSELTVGVNSTATTLSVAVTSGPLWTTDPGEFPLGIVIGGEEMTVTGITGTSSPQTFTVVRSSNSVTKSHVAGAQVRVAQPAVAAL
ncbi:hypothetical protein [Streptomyces sp. NPDC053541]|uniref:hypothetical protein n=1 Tax=Streptomyces sp. NPDC053541 TaxID=3365709 RepID=UPI0037D44E8F